MMHEYPIIFGTPMIRALLDGRKTQTRRLIRSPLRKVQPGDKLWVRETIAVWMHMPSIQDIMGTFDKNFIIYKATEPEWDAYMADVNFLKERNCVNSEPTGNLVVKPSIHMPRWASRITLEVTEVRTQNLHDITEEDAVAEGLAAITKDGGHTIKYGIPDRDGLPGIDDIGLEWSRWNTDPRLAYKDLWESLYGLGSWEYNPDIITISFSSIHQPKQGAV